MMRIGKTCVLDRQRKAGVAECSDVEFVLADRGDLQGRGRKVDRLEQVGLAVMFGHVRLEKQEWNQRCRRADPAGADLHGGLAERRM
jgi:hypothetical protein